MSESIWPAIHAERQSLLDDVRDLTPQQWALPTMCGEWNVHQVLAHLTSLARMTPVKFVTRFAGAGFNFDKYAGNQVAALSAGGPDATLEQFRAAVGRETAPPGPKESWLGENFVHAEDIRRALGRTHNYALPEVGRALEFYSRSDPIIGGKTRLAGLTMKATDADLSVGSGPLVEGPAISLLVAATGRKDVLDELSGPGVETLRSRS
jgi:uncharacterized protein (TIGR03083 family)